MTTEASDDDTERLLTEIQDDSSKAIRIDRDGLFAWVRYQDGYEVYSRTDGFLQDRLFETDEQDVRTKINKYGGTIIPVSSAPFDPRSEDTSIERNGNGP